MKRCSLNNCNNDQTGSTWTNVRLPDGTVVTVGVCEEHWQVLRTVR